MRKEAEVIKEILDFANEENKVRAVMMNGSRVNPNAIKDIMQDYDVVFFVTDLESQSYKINHNWIERFGELVILQQNDFEEGAYIIMMQFKDGVRIDLSFRDIKKVQESVMEDSLTKILMDKDGIIPPLPQSNDSTYHVQKPTEKEFDMVMNEAWWIQSYVAKGIWRDELPLAKYMFDVILMDCVREMLSWHIAMNNDWSINVGKCGKWFKRYLPEELYKEFTELYPTTAYEEMWVSLFKVGEFIRKIGTEVGEKLGYNYPIEDDERVTEFLKMIKEMPRSGI